MKGEFGWSDVGTWHSFHEISPKDENNNVSNSEQVRLIETKECIINVPQDKKVIIEGVENCIIAENNDIFRGVRESIQAFRRYAKTYNKGA